MLINCMHNSISCISLFGMHTLTYIRICDGKRNGSIERFAVEQEASVSHPNEYAGAFYPSISE